MGIFSRKKETSVTNLTEVSKSQEIVNPKRSIGAFIKAINSGNLEGVIKNFDIKYADQYSDSYTNCYHALYQSAIEGNNEIMIFLIESGADPFINSNSTISRLISNNNIEMCNYFLDNVDIDEKNLLEILNIAKEKESNSAKLLVYAHCNYKLNSWKKDNQTMISNTEHSMSTDTTIKSIFNFQSANKITIITTPESEFIKSEEFKDIGDKEELELACDKLTEQGGTPDKSKIYASNNTDKHNKTPFINQPKQRT